jgi:arginyl-tRNA synthetase
MKISKTPTQIVEKIIYDSIKQLYPQAQSNYKIAIETFKGKNYGHLSSSIPLELSKILKRNPIEIGDEIVGKIYSHQDSVVVDKAINVKGFINLYLKLEFQVDFLKEKIEENNFGYSETLKGEKILIEHTNANPFKEPHIGHLMNNIIGESIFRLTLSASAESYSICYQGDVGIHVAKCIYGILKSIESKKYSLDDFLSSNKDTAIEYINEAYKIGSELYENQVDKKSIQLLNVLIFHISQEFPKRKGLKIVNDYPIPDLYNTKYDIISKIYFKGRKESLEYFLHIFKKYGSNFDRNYFESETGEIGSKIVKENPLFEKSEGAVIWDGKKYGRNVQVLTNQYGIPTYGCKDIGLVFQKIEDYSPTTLLTLTASEQKFYFEDMFEIFRQLGISKNFKHICHGELKLLGREKMSSRTGNIVSAKDILEELTEEIQIKFNSKKGQKALENRSEKIAISALKFMILKSNPGSDIKFDKEKSLELTGNTGPYLLYTYARCRSILKKGGIFNLDRLPDSINEDEKELLVNLLFFEEILSRSTTELNPSILANYLNQVSQLYNKFYNNCSIINRTNDITQNFRLFLTLSVSKIIDRGCYLLGFETIEEL